MARKQQISGLSQKPNGIWHIDKQVKGRRICESTGTSDREEAERFLIFRLDQLRQERVYGARPVIHWVDAATRFLMEFSDQPSIKLTATYLKQLHPFIGGLPLTHIDDDSLRPFVAWMKKGGVMPDGGKKKPSSNRTINIALQRVVRVLNMCHRKWRDDLKRPWLDSVPSISMQDEAKTGRDAYPLSWDEQRLFFRELPEHLQAMALFKVNTGTREQEVCKLSWHWEIAVPELGTSVFIVPANFGGREENSGVKNGDDRVIVLNSVARSVIEAQRGKHPELVFPYKGRALHRMNDTAWQSARERAAGKWLAEYSTQAHAGFRAVRVHDLKHTFGRRLKAAGVSFEDRQALLGHKSGSVTSHYSGAELAALIDAANKVSATDTKTPTLTILRSRAGGKAA